MRILHVIDTLDFGGAEKVMVALANGFSAEHEVCVCCISHAGELARELDSSIDLVCMNRPDGNDYLLPFRLAGYMRRKRFDIVHTHNWGVFLEGGIAALIAQIPVAIHTVHGPYQPSDTGWIQRAKRKLRHAVERLVAQGFRRVVAVSDSVRNYIPTTVGIGPDRVCTVHNGIAGGALPIVRRSSGPVAFITVGRLDAIKNHEMMLRAFARVLNALPGCVLTIVGDGPERPAIEALIEEMGLSSDVRMLGFRTDIAELLVAADVFLMSSRYEGISIAVLEAMRATLPVVATHVGGIPETVLSDRTGLLVASEDIDAFATAMLVLARSPDLRHEYGASARNLQLKEFSLEAMLSRYADLYASPAPLPEQLTCR